MAQIASLWIGNPLTKIEYMCISSFIQNGHDFTLFVYDTKMQVPPGTKKEDARKIVKEDRIFKIDNSFGPFADMFRYKMIKDTGLIWTDTDNICLRPDWDFPEYVFGKQGGEHDLCANGIIKSPKDSKFIKDLVSISDKFNKDEIKWGEIGPQLLTKTLKKHRLDDFIMPPEAFYPVHYWEWKDLWNRKKIEQVLERSKESYTIQIWNQMLSRQNYDKNILPKGSALHHFYGVYV